MKFQKVVSGETSFLLEYVSGRTKDVSLFQNEVVLDIAEKTLLIQLSLTGDTQEPS